MIQHILRSVIRRVKDNEEYKKVLKELDVEDRVIVYVIDDYGSILKIKLKDVAGYSICSIYDTYLQAFIGRLKERFER